MKYLLLIPILFVLFCNSKPIDNESSTNIISSISTSKSLSLMNYITSKKTFSNGCDCTGQSYSEYSNQFKLYDRNKIKFITWHIKEESDDFTTCVVDILHGIYSLNDNKLNITLSSHIKFDLVEKNGIEPNINNIRIINKTINPLNSSFHLSFVICKACNINNNCQKEGLYNSEFELSDVFIKDSNDCMWTFRELHFMTKIIDLIK